MERASTTRTSPLRLLADAAWVAMYIGFVAAVGQVARWAVGL
jgi:hypothetical protein